MTAAPCGDPHCPVADPAAALLARVRTQLLKAGTVLRRGHKQSRPDPTVLVPGLGNTRFAPLDGVAHTYLATTPFAALLESALHEAAPPAPRAYEAAVGLWMESAVRLQHDVRLIDLRDAELHRLGVARHQLVATSAAHYPCTRRWAQALHGRHVGGHPTHGLLWHSRQRELHAQVLHDRPALRDLITEHPATVAVLWAPPGQPGMLAPAPGGLGRLDTGAGYKYVEDLTALLGIVFD